MLIVTGVVVVGRESVDELKVLAAKLAVSTRAEPGCQAYELYQDVEDQTRFRIYEEWDNEDALFAHFKTPHMAEFNTAVKGLEIESMRVVKFEPGEISPVA